MVTRRRHRQLWLESKCLAIILASLTPLTIADPGDITPDSLTFDVFKPCVPATVQWQGAGAPYDINFVTILPGEITYSLSFYNIPDTRFTFIPNFPPNSAVYFYNAQQNLTIGDSGDTSCVVSFQSLPQTEFDNQDPLLLTSDLSHVAQCSAATITFDGRGAPPWRVFTEQPAQSNVITSGFLFGNLQNQSFTAKLPYPAGATYSIVLNDSGTNSSVSDPFKIGNGTDTSCLVQQLPKSATPLAPILGGSIGGTLALVAVVLGTVLVVRAKRRKRKQPKELFPEDEEDQGRLNPEIQLGVTPFVTQHKYHQPATIAPSGPQDSHEEPVYHQDGGRAEFPPAYNDRRESR